jgi:hypothetical protein
MPTKITKKYNSRNPHFPEYPIDHPKNRPYVRSLAKHLLSNTKNSAKPHHLKYPGVRDTGNVGKKNTLTVEQVEKKILESGGVCAITGDKLHFANLGVMQYPTAARREGLLTEEQSPRRPSVDRIDSSKPYEAGNIQIVTIRGNAGKGSYDVPQRKEVATVLVEVGAVKFTFNEVSASYIGEVYEKLVK